MGKLVPTKPLLFMLYGMPGSGKSFVARQLSESMSVAYVQGDRIRAELFESPTYSKQENHIIASLMTYMTQEFLKAGVSVIFDVNVMRLSQRRALRNMATRMGVEPVLLWVQIDPDTAFARAAKRDRRKMDDRFAQELTIEQFKHLLGGMQHPEPSEQYVVLSGKHVFSTQKNAVLRYLHEKQLIGSTPGMDGMSKPGLINLVPNPGAGRVDFTRRNISIR
jgi:predicted kinase